MFLRFYLFETEERECTCMHELGRREGQADSMLSVDPNAELNPMTLKSGSELKSKV